METKTPAPCRKLASPASDSGVHLATVAAKSEHELGAGKRAHTTRERGGLRLITTAAICRSCLCRSTPS